MDTRTSPHRARIAKTQDALARHGLAALLVPSSDPHLSEYLPERWQGRQWLSGFTGSMGTLVVTPAQAALFADSRYWQQAEDQLLGSGIVLGARVPITLTSRADSVQSRLTSCAVAALVAHRRRQQAAGLA